VTPVLSADDISILQASWHEHDDPTKDMPFGSTLFSKDADLRRRMHETVASIVSRNIAEIMPSATIVYGGFANKAPREEASGLPFHQDPSFVDESRYGSANIWIPLVDIDDSNGALWVVPGSHCFNRGRRAFNQSFAYEALEGALRATYARPLYPRAGEAIVFAHTLFHFSPPNHSDRPRLVAGGLIVKTGAPLFYHYTDAANRREIEVYDADQALFLKTPIGTRPTGPLAGRYPAAMQPITIDDVHGASERAAAAGFLARRGLECCKSFSAFAKGHNLTFDGFKMNRIQRANVTVSQIHGRL
jgi:hypothetical protein